MRIKTIAASVFAVFSVGTAILSARTSAPQTQNKVFDFTNKPSRQGLQEIATILRTVGDIQQLSIDPAASSLTVGGTTDQLAMTGWIVRQLDQPVPADASAPQPATASTQQFLVAGKSDDVIRVFHLNHVAPKPPQAIQEILTTLRTVADVQKVFNYTSLSDLVVRGPAAQIAFSEYLINSLDVAPGSVTTSPEFHYQAPGQSSQVARVFYLANAKVPQQIQELLTVLRTVIDIQKVFNFSSLNALAIRGTASDIATSEWIIQSLDIPASAKPGPSAAIRQFVIPANTPGGGIVRVFYPSHIDTPQAMQQTLTALRTKLFIQKVFNYTALPAIVVRDSADQIAKAEQLILVQDQLAKTTP